MASFIHHNGRTKPANELSQLPDFRKLEPDDGLFETMLFDNERILFRDAHLARLRNGMDMMKLELPELYSNKYLFEAMEQQAMLNGFKKARIRLYVFRNHTGLRSIKEASYCIQSEAFDIPARRSYSLIMFHDARKSADATSLFKHCNHQPYFMASQQAEEKGYDDALVLNANGAVCDSTRANVFMIEDERIITPPLSEGCIAGVFREHLIRSLQKEKIPVTEKTIGTEELMQADEIFLTNSVRGIMPVHEIEGIKKSMEKSMALARRFPVTGESFSGRQK